MNIKLFLKDAATEGSPHTEKEKTCKKCFNKDKLD